MAKGKIDQFGRTRYDAVTEQGNLLFNIADNVMVKHYRGGFATQKAKEYFIEDLIIALEELFENSKDNEKLNMDCKINLEYVKKHTVEIANQYPENHVPSRKEVLALYAEE